MHNIYYVNLTSEIHINSYSYPHKKACFFGFTQSYPHYHIIKHMFEDTTKTPIISLVYIKCPNFILLYIAKFWT